MYLFFYSQNILELTVFDKDPVTKDDIQFTVLFDVANVRPGVVAHETFSLKSEVRTEISGRLEESFTAPIYIMY